MMKERRAKRAKRVAIMKRLYKYFLWYFIFFTAYFSMMTLSKYIGTVTGTGTTTIAKWEVAVDDTDNASNTLDVVIGNATQSYILKITSTSDVKAMYSIVLSNLPSNVEVKLENSSTYPNYQTPTNNTITFSNVGYINANANSNDRTITHTLTFNVPINTVTINASEIDIDVIFNQANPTSN